MKDFVNQSVLCFIGNQNDLLLRGKNDSITWFGTVSIHPAFAGPKCYSTSDANFQSSSYPFTIFNERNASYLLNIAFLC